MLFDVKDLEFKKLVEAGDIHALEKLAKKYSKLGHWDLADKYFIQILESEKVTDAKPYLEALTYLGASALDNEAFVYAYKVYDAAKDFMEKNLDEEEWRLDIYEYLKYAKKLVRLLKKGNQQSYFELAKCYEEKEFSFFYELLIEDYSFYYYQKVIEKKCKIDKLDYIYAHVFVANCHIEQDEPVEAFELLRVAKTFMEKKLSAEYWYLPLYESMLLAKKRLLEADR